MWIQLDDKELALVKDALEYLMSGSGHPEAEALLKAINERTERGPNDAAYIGAAREVFATDDLEIDDDPNVSLGGDPGAWVHAWVWVSDEDAGIQTEDEDENICRTCSETYAEGGDGYDGECPSCADKTDQKLNPENYT